MALPKPTFVSVQEAARQLEVSDEIIRFYLKEGHLAIYLPTPWSSLNLNYEGKLADVAKVVRPFQIEGDKIYFKNLHLLAKDTMRKVDEIQGGVYYMRDVRISFPDIEKLRSTENQETEDEFIKRRRVEKVEEAIIAFELKENYKLTFYQIADKLNLRAGLNENQHDALKQRGKRLVDKGKVLVQDCKKP